MNTSNEWGSIALLTLMVYHRVRITEYAPALTYRPLFVHTRRDDLAYTCTSYSTFRSSFGRTAKFKIWPIRHWGGDAHSNPQYAYIVVYYKPIYCAVIIYLGKYLDYMNNHTQGANNLPSGLTIENSCLPNCQII